MKRAAGKKLSRRDNVPMDTAFVEREYNNRALVPDHGDYFARWERDSQFVRSTLPCRLDLAYGPDPRHRIDYFPAANARGSLVFIHGGYWRSLDKSMFSWLAASWVAAGINVAMVNYRLAPAVRIEAIVDDTLAATNWLMTQFAGEAGWDRVVVSGHSAGGHLTAALFAAPATALRFDPARVVGGVPISGLADFAPLQLFSFNADFKLDACRGGAPEPLRQAAHARRTARGGGRRRRKLGVRAPDPRCSRKPGRPRCTRS